MNKEAFLKITYGLYIVSSRDGNNYNGHVSNTVFQVSADPARFAIASHKDNLSTEYIRKSGSFSITVLQQEVDLEFLGPWGFKSGKSIDKFVSVNYKIGKTGVPILLEKAIAWVECEVTDIIDTGSHILFIGKAIDAEITDPKGKPLTYAYYREVIKGLSPENAPTYTGDKLEIANVDIQGTPKTSAAKYQCKVCGFIYDPEEGDPHAGIAPGTAFEDLPDDWECPVCGVSKKDFIRID